MNEQVEKEYNEYVEIMLIKWEEFKEAFPDLTHKYAGQSLGPFFAECIREKFKLKELNTGYGVRLIPEDTKLIMEIYPYKLDLYYKTYRTDLI